MGVEDTLQASACSHLLGDSGTREKTPRARLVLSSRGAGELYQKPLMIHPGGQGTRTVLGQDWGLYSWCEDRSGGRGTLGGGDGGQVLDWASQLSRASTLRGRAWEPLPAYDGPQPLSSDAIKAGTRLPDNPSLGQGTWDNSGGDHTLNQTQAA